MSKRAHRVEFDLFLIYAPPCFHFQPEHKNNQTHDVFHLVGTTLYRHHSPQHHSSGISISRAK